MQYLLVDMSCNYAIFVQNVRDKIISMRFFVLCGRETIISGVLYAVHLFTLTCILFVFCNHPLLMC